MPQSQGELAILQEQLQNLELQMQAQFDEWVTEQDKSLQDKLSKFSSMMQHSERKDEIYVSKEQLSQIQYTIDGQIAELQSNLDKFMLMQQSSHNPLNQKLEDLQIEIGQKVVEVNQQQEVQIAQIDQQIAQFVEQIKQISDNLENVQDIVV